MKSFRFLSLLAVLAVVPACMDMDVENLNDPDRERALSEPGDVEALLSTGFYRYWNGTQKTSPGMALAVVGNELTSSWGNFSMQDQGTVPRRAWDNSPTYGYRGFNVNPWNNLYQSISNVTDGLVAIEGGTRFVDDSGVDQTERARAYAKFVQGIAHGWLALFYDQAIIFDETVDLEAGVPDFSPYPEVMAAALAYLDEAIQLASQNSFQLPDVFQGWINGRPLTNQELARWAHSFKARYMASVARTPAERAAVNWAQVVQHVDQGVDVEVDGPNGDNLSIWWWATGYYPHSWIRAAYDLIGPSDNSGAYAAWKATPPPDRNSFHIETDDRRVTGTAGPESSGKYVRFLGGTPFRPERGMYFQSWYEYSRYIPWVSEGGGGTMPLFFKEEANLLKAEAALRQGNKNQAIDLINISRTENGELPALAYTISDAETWAALRYEHGIELASSISGISLFNKRGWGTMVCGSPLQYPVPGAELEQLQIPNYTFGGDGEGAARPETGCAVP